MKILTKNGKPLIDEEGKLLATNDNNNVTQSMIEVTYEELKSLRDNSKLIAGQQYRITDYECTTSEKDTKSAGHRFDIIVTADSENTLNENARATYNKNDDYFSKKEKQAIITSADFKEGITYKDIIPYYTLYVDFGESYNGTNEGIKGGSDQIVEIGYETNNYGVEVPVFYKNDTSYIESGEEGTDYEDIFFYDGTYELDGIVYDKWRKIEPSLSWSDSEKLFILTNQVVDSEYSEIEVTIKNNINSWEIKYCLDNDSSRFSWAFSEYNIYTDDELWFNYSGIEVIDGVIYYKWYNPDFNAEGIEYNYLVSTTLELKLGDSLGIFYDGTMENNYSTVTLHSEEGVFKKQGKGVIYYMKDEWGNEAPYDFKNIMFYVVHQLFTVYVGYTYTFNYEGKKDTSNIINIYNLLDGNGKTPRVSNNIIKPAYNGKNQMILNHNVFIGTKSYEENLYYGCSNNKIGGNCIYNYFGNNCQNNELGNDCSFNSIRNDFSFNKLEDGCNNNSFKDYSVYNKLGSNSIGNTFGDNLKSNTFGKEFCRNVIGDDWSNNIFGNFCTDNIFESFECSNNIFGNECIENRFGKNSNLINNKFGNCFSDNFLQGSNTNLANAMEYNVFGNNCNDNYMYDDFKYNKIGNKFYGNFFHGYFYNNVLDDYFQENIFYRYCEYNTFGKYAHDNKFHGECKRNTFDIEFRHNEFEHSCTFNILDGNDNNFKGIFYKNELINCEHCIFEYNTSNILLEQNKYINFVMPENSNTTAYIKNYIIKTGLSGTFGNVRTITLEPNLDYTTIVKPKGQLPDAVIEVEVGGEDNE